MDDWVPASRTEQRLLDALRDNDFAGYVATVAEARLVVLVGGDPVRPLTVTFDDATRAVVAYTSTDGLSRVVASEHAREAASFTELVEHWPDPSWVLSLNPGLPIAAHLPGERLADVLATVFAPVNEVERAMLAARHAGDGGELLLTVLGAELYLPLRADGGPSRDVTDPQFPWLVERYGEDAYLPVYTSQERLRGRHGELDFVVVDAPPLVRAWPDDAWTLAVNPGSPLAATLTGPMVRGIQRTFADLVADPLEHLDPGGEWWPRGPESVDDVVLQVAVAHQAVGHYVSGGYDRVAGTVHLRPPDGRLVTPASLYLRVGLLRPGGPFSTADTAVHVIRWRPPAERAREWLADPAPRTGSAVLPNGSALYRLSADGTEELRAAFDAGERRWVPVTG